MLEKACPAMSVLVRRMTSIGVVNGERHTHYVLPCKLHSRSSACRGLPFASCVAPSASVPPAMFPCCHHHRHQHRSLLPGTAGLSKTSLDSAVYAQSNDKCKWPTPILGHNINVEIQQHKIPHSEIATNNLANYNATLIQCRSCNNLAIIVWLNGVHYMR